MSAAQPSERASVSGLAPLVSICVPTYNRAASLRRVLTSICTQEAFRTSDTVEVVVSDNASEDDTGAVVREFIAQYGAKVRYQRNASNIHDRNFEAALALGRGELLKLNNDMLEHEPGSLRQLIELVMEQRVARPVLFFVHRTDGPPRRVACATLDAFVREVSYDMTWIAGFAIWRTDLAALVDFSRHAALQLVQVDVILRQLGAGRPALVLRAPLWRPSPKRNTGGYDLLRVFMDNYFGLLAPYVATGALSRETYEQERRRTLYGHIVRWVAMSKVGCQASFDVRDHWSYVRRHFGAAPGVRLGYALRLAGNLVKYALKRFVLDNRDRLARWRAGKGRS